MNHFFYFWIFWSLAVSTALYLYFSRIQKRGLNFEVSWNFICLTLLSSFLGARLFHVIYEEPLYYSNSPMEVFAFWNGGLVFYGALLGVFISTLIYFKKIKTPPWDWLDTLAPCISLGYAIGRVGCLLNGCCYGKFCDLPWAIEQKHPTQIYATLLELCVLFFILKIEKITFKKAAGLTFCIWLFLHASARLFVEAFRDDPRGPVLAHLSISTWISFILLTSSVGVGLSLVKKK